jgi:RNA polymerase sigma-70 factor (ECF subfamily)
VARLADILIAAAPEALRAELGRAGDLGDRLRALVDDAHREHPDIEVEDSDLVEHLATRLPTDRSAELALDKVRAADLLLALACGRGDAGALDRFRELHLANIRRNIQRAAPESKADEVMQQLMTKLFVRRDDDEPAILKYAGRGSLAAWVEIIATREARNQIKKDRRIDAAERPLDLDRLVDGAIETADPELAHLKHTYKVKFREAFERALAELSGRERNILRLEYLDGLSGEQIGALYGVHKATITRWRQRSRAALFTEIRRIFEREHDMPAREFESVMRLIQSQFDLSLTRILRDKRSD